MFVGHVALRTVRPGHCAAAACSAVLRLQLSASPRPVSRARTSSPCVIFFDEIDGLVSMRDSNGDHGVGVGERMLSQLLQEMDGLQVHCASDDSRHMLQFSTCCKHTAHPVSGLLLFLLWAFLLAAVAKRRSCYCRHQPPRLLGPCLAAARED